MTKSIWCAIGFLCALLVLQDCIVPSSAVRVRVVKVRKQPRQDSNGHYVKRQVSRNSYTDLPLAGDPVNPDAEQFQPNQQVSYNNNNNNNNNINRTPVNRQYPGQQQNQQQQSYQPIQPQPNYNRVPQQVPQQQAPAPQRQQQKQTKNEDDCPGCGNSIPGDAGVDYPNYHVPPKTGFSCSKQQYSGYYADTEARCQVFWICQKNRADAFLCPNGTIFNQQVFVCDWWFNSDCNTAPDYYSRNQYLYAGPTVDIFGNTITVNQNPTGINNVNSNKAAAAAPQRRATTPVPIKLEVSPAPVAYNNGPTGAPIIRQQPVQQSYNKRSQQLQQGGFNQNQFNQYDSKPVQTTALPVRLQQGFPVPENSLEALEHLDENQQRFGAKMNNYQTAMNYIDRSQEPRWNGQQQYNNNNNFQQQPQQQYNNNNNNNNYQQQQPQQNFNNNGGFEQRRGVAYDAPQQYRQPLFAATESVQRSEATTVAYGQKTPRSQQYRDTTSASSNIQVNSADLAAPVKFSPARLSTTYPSASTSTTTKRNAIDVLDENTTPLTTDPADDDLTLSPLTTPRYGEVAADADDSSRGLTLLDLEAEEEDVTTTTAAPLTFGQKLTRAARKRNTSTWGNWRTMFLGADA